MYLGSLANTDHLCKRGALDAFCSWCECTHLPAASARLGCACSRHSSQQTRAMFM